MNRNFKINTAIFICMAFIFRILFVNIGVISSLNTNHHSAIKGHFASTIKKRKQTETVNQHEQVSFSIAEMCEENTDEDEQIKFNPFVLLQNLYSLFTNKFSFQLEKITPPFDLLSSFSSDRYLKLQVIRI